MADTDSLLLVSTSDSGVKGDRGGALGCLSADGTRLVFVSSSTNLVPAGGGLPNVFAKDLVTGETTLVTQTPQGDPSGGEIGDACISADGTTAAFATRSALDPADDDAWWDVYVRNLVTQELVLASTSDAGVKGNVGNLFDPVVSLSADGTRVAFVSASSNLDPADTDHENDVYVKDLITGDITLASTTSSGVKGNGNSLSASLSGDGTKVAFCSGATNLVAGVAGGVYVKDLVTGELTLASTPDDGTPRSVACWPKTSLSADGTRVAFVSTATDLDPNDTDTMEDVYVKDLVTSNLTLASTSDEGVKGTRDVQFPYVDTTAVLSGDGTKVVFWTQASNLDPADTDTLADVYVKNLVTGDISLVSAAPDGSKGNEDSFHPSLSHNGQDVMFTTVATNFDPADTDLWSDVYIRRFSGGPPPIALDYVALGDSYSSGLGTGLDSLGVYDPSAYDPGTTGGKRNNSCYRSRFAYPRIIAEEAANIILDVQAGNHAACAGNTSQAVRNNQLGHLSDDIDLVTITVGGNDVGFRELAVTCSAPSLKARPCWVVGVTALARIALAENDWAELFSAISESARDARVIVMGYPLIVPETPQEGCGGGWWYLSPSEQLVVQSVGIALNAALQDAVDQASALGDHDISFLDVSDAFRGGDVCAGTDRFVNQPVLPTLPVLTTLFESFHPNRAGHTRLAECLAAAIESAQLDCGPPSGA